MSSLFSPIIKKAHRFQRVVIFWCSIGASISIIWIAWLILQYLGSLVGPSISTFIKLILMSIWVIFLLIIVTDEVTWAKNKRFNQIMLSFLSFFTINVMFGGIKVMVFPISIICLLWSFFEAHSHLEDDNDDDIKDLPELRLMGSTSKSSDFSTRFRFRFHLVCPHLVSLAILCLLATLHPRLFEGCIILGAMNITFSALLASNELYALDMVSLAIRDALRVDVVSNEVVDELKSIYPIGFDTDRIQYLLHDTLRKGGQRGKWQGRSSYTTVDVVQKLINIFPSDIMKVVDDKGNTPFLTACQYSSAEVVECLVRDDILLDSFCMSNRLLDTQNDRGDTALHYACRGRNYKVVKFLLNRHMQLVTKRNAEGDLPVYLLCAAGKYSGRFDDPEHVETIWRLLLAYPEDISLINNIMKKVE